MQISSELQSVWNVFLQFLIGRERKNCFARADQRILTRHNVIGSYSFILIWMHFLWIHLHLSSLALLLMVLTLSCLLRNFHYSKNWMFIIWKMCHTLWAIKLEIKLVCVFFEVERVGFCLNHYLISGSNKMLKLFWP